jgi:hypothetical protein
MLADQLEKLRDELDELQDEFEKLSDDDDDLDDDDDDLDDDVCCDCERRKELRNYFAAHALQGIIAKSPYTEAAFGTSEFAAQLHAIGGRVRGAYDYADAMLEVSGQ